MRKLEFNQEWLFCKDGNTPEVVTLPHDAMLEENRDPSNPSGAACGFFAGGIYHYKKNFVVPMDWNNKTACLWFEGVYQNAVVKLNGEEIARCDYGYNGFSAPLNTWNIGEENEIEVIADNSRMPNSRWYTGSGIYRPVWLLLGEKNHIFHNGVKITTISIDPAVIRVETRYTGGEVRVAVLDGETTVATSTGSNVELEIPDAKLWSDETPNLYRCVVTLMENGEVIDSVTDNFGVRMIAWSNHGLFINGKETMLRGGCVHHDNGILGAKCYKESEWRKVRLLKEAGFNAIRSAHNPCSEEMLRACDYYGMYMIDESWDMWFGHKNRWDYATHFMKNYLSDLTAMVEKDYNHPSVIMYSIGNEVAEPATSEGFKIEKEMIAHLHELDATRPVTGGFNIMIMGMAKSGNAIYDETGEKEDSNPADQKTTNNSLMFNVITTMTGAVMDNMANFSMFDKASAAPMDALDIAGYNYAAGRYPKEGKLHPNRLIFGSETFHHAIVKNWRMVKKYPYLIGDFMWTSWDYLGEAGSGAWGYTKDATGFQKPYPWLLSDMGALDILGNPNGALFLAQAVWGQLEKPVIAVQPVNHGGKRPAKSAWRGTNAIPSWSWENCEGTKAVVEVYFDADKVQLLCNGKQVGTKKVKDYKANFKLPYEPGILEAVAFDESGNEVGRSSLTSANGEKKLTILPENPMPKAGEILYVSVQVQGENGIVECNADRTVSLEVSGGELLGFGSANPRTEESFISGEYSTYYGHAQAVIRCGNDASVCITAKDGSEVIICRIPVRRED